MNPPPLPPPTDNNSIAHQAAKASLAAGLLAIGVLVIGRNNRVTDLIAGALALGGFIAGVIALAGIPAYGKKDILNRGLTGLLVSGMLLTIFTINFSNARRKAAASRAAWQQFSDSGENMRSDFKKSYDPKAGITNLDLTRLNKMRDGLKSASQNLSGDDASLAEVMAAYLDRTQSALKNYQAAATKLREAHVLDQFDSSDKSQFTPRHEVIHQFLDANAALKQVLTNSEDVIRSELLARNISKLKVDTFIASYHASVAPQNALTLQIRQCDDRVGAAMLDALSTLEAGWGQWKSNPDTDLLVFENETTREAYNYSIITMNAASKEQLKLQGQLVNLPSANQPGR